MSEKDSPLMVNIEPMAHKAIRRTLWYNNKENTRVLLSQDDLLQRSESIVILGEAGMGKSYLLDWLAKKPGYARCTARQLINRAKPQTLLGDAKVLLIDALDEVSTQQGADAVDQVLRKLGELDYPNFVLSCRVADWRSSTGVETIQEQYPDKPLELHLEPFNDDDAIDFLGSRLGIDTARVVIEHFNTRKLHGLLGNPQTLEMIVNVANKGPLPETRGALFASAIDVLLSEHKDAKQACQPAKEVGLDAAGAAFAGLILTGNEALVRKAAANVAEGELLLADTSLLPGAKEIEAVLGTRLFKADGTDRFSYWHRRIGEFLAARWLAKNANTQRKRRRLLALFHTHGLVPSNLRGLHAWLAREPSLAMQVITADPMGVIEYGDADDLSLEQARTLIKALQRLATDNPNFRDWGQYSMRGIDQPELIYEVHELITHPDTPFGLRLLILEVIKGAKIATDLTNELRKLVLDDTALFEHRRAAAEAFVESDTTEDWAHIVRKLYEYGNTSSIRLAIEIIDNAGYVHFEDELIAKLVILHTQTNNNLLGVLIRLQENLPDTRLVGILDYLASAEPLLISSGDSLRTSDIADFAFHLIARRIANGDISAKILWSWLEQFDSNKGYQRESRDQLNYFILNNDFLRQEIQYLALLKKINDIPFHKKLRFLLSRSQSFLPTCDDIIALLKKLDKKNRTDERWRNIFNIIIFFEYPNESQEKIREAVRPFAEHRPDLLTWIDKPRTNELKKEQARQNKITLRRRGKSFIQRIEQCQRLLPKINHIRSGESDALTEPANIYLNTCDDLEESLPAFDRIAHHLGNEIADAAYIGFERFITLSPSLSTRNEISDSLAKYHNSKDGNIIVVALSERFRKNIEFDDLSDHFLIIGFINLLFIINEINLGMNGLTQALEIKLKTRGIFGVAMHLHYNPKFEAGPSHIDDLYILMRNEKHIAVATELAAEWLEYFPNMHHALELELIFRLLRSGSFDKLRRARERFTDKGNEERRRNWDSIGVLVDFEKTVAQFKTFTPEPKLLWHLKRFIIEITVDGAYTTPSPLQLEWIISTFRQIWPPNSRPTDALDPWGADEHLLQLIRHLGKNASRAATISMKYLVSEPRDRYTETIKSVAAEQARIRVEVAYAPPALDAIHAIALDSAPLNTADLRTFMMEELAVVQEKIKSDDAESWRGFYNNNTAWGEERCRDHLLSLLRQGSEGVVLEPESHVADDKEADITCSVGTLRIPIEIKGQWHPQLWHGADKQLDALYTSDWRANGHGIYLVLWFGAGQPENKSLQSPGRSKQQAQNPEELCQMLTASSKAASEGRVKIFVLDLTRP